MTETLVFEAVSRVFPGPRTGFFARRTRITALNRVSLTVDAGECVGIVGESGSGKSTLIRIAAGLVRPSAGRVLVAGRDVATNSRRERRAMRRRLQLVFQHPLDSLNPRHTVATTLETPLRQIRRFSRHDTGREVRRLLEQVELGSELSDRYPHELSGGQAQRVAIARALAADPKILLLDEPTSALDVSSQRQILDLLHELRHCLGLTYVFVSHDLAVIEHIADRVAVLLDGRIIEEGAPREVFASPQETYTRALVDSVPIPGQRRIVRTDARASS